MENTIATFAPCEFVKVKAGDRLRLTKGNGDVHEFTVTRTTPHTFESHHNTFQFLVNDGDKLEVLQKPLPTKPGLYALHPEKRLDGYRHLFLTRGGTWHEASFSDEGFGNVIHPEASVFETFRETLTLVYGGEN